LWTDAPRPDDLATLVDALAIDDALKAAEHFALLPEPWRSILEIELKPQNVEPHPGLYLVAHYCATRAQRFDVIPRDREQWLALHVRCLGAMKLNAGGRPSKQLPRITGDLLKLLDRDLRSDLLALEHEGAVSSVSVRAILQQAFEDWTVPEGLIADIIKDRSKEGRSWSGLRSVLAEWAGISISEIRSQVTETSRLKPSTSPGVPPKTP